MEQLFSCRTAATHYSMSQVYFRTLLKERKIPFIKLGYNTRMKKSDLDAHFEAKITEQNKSCQPIELKRETVDKVKKEQVQ